MKRKSLILVCALLLMTTFVLGACNRGKNSGFTEDGKFLLTVWGGDEYVGETRTKLQNFINQFNESDRAAELNVELTFAAQTNLPGTLTGALMTANGPDLVIWDRYMTPTGTDILTPLDDFIAADDVDLGLLNQEAMSELVYGGKTYGIPLDLDPWGIYVNLDVVADYNSKVGAADKVDVNDLDTWSKLKRAAENLTVRSGNEVTRAGLNVTSMDGQFVSYLFGAATSLINLDPNSPNYGDTNMQLGGSGVVRTEEAKRINDLFFFIDDLYKSNLCSNSLGGTDAFVAGKTAMTYGSMFFPQTIKNQIAGSSTTVNYKFIPFPQRDMLYAGTQNHTLVDPDAIVGGLKNGCFGGMMGGYGLSIAYPAHEYLRTARWEDRRNKSWEVINAIIFEDEINKMFFTNTEQITTRTDLVTDAFYDAESVMKDAIPYLDFYRIRPNIAGYETFESNVLRAQLQSMYEGSQTVNTTYSNVLSLGNAELRRAQGR